MGGHSPCKFGDPRDHRFEPSGRSGVGVSDVLASRWMAYQVYASDGMATGFCTGSSF